MAEKTTALDGVLHFLTDTNMEMVQKVTSSRLFAFQTPGHLLNLLRSNTETVNMGKEKGAIWEQMDPKEV